MAAFPPEWEATERSLRADVEAGITTLLNGVNQLNTLLASSDAQLAANSVQAIRTLAQGLKAVGRQTVRLSRLHVAAFDSNDTGT